ESFLFSVGRNVRERIRARQSTEQAAAIIPPLPLRAFPGRRNGANVIRQCAAPAYRVSGRPEAITRYEFDRALAIDERECREGKRERGYRSLEFAAQSGREPALIERRTSLECGCVDEHEGVAAAHRFVVDEA